MDAPVAVRPPPHSVGVGEAESTGRYRGDLYPIAVDNVTEQKENVTTAN